MARKFMEITYDGVAARYEGSLIDALLRRAVYLSLSLSLSLSLWLDKGIQRSESRRDSRKDESFNRLTFPGGCQL